MKNQILEFDRRPIYWVMFFVPGFLLVVDLMLLGSGFWSEPFGVSVRKLCFLSVCLYSSFFWLRFSPAVNFELLPSFCLLIFIFVWCFFIPLFRSGSLSDAVSDAQLFVGLLFSPGIYFVLKEENLLKFLNHWMFRYSIVLALIHLGIALSNFLLPSYTPELIEVIKKLLEPLRDEADTSVFIGYVGEDFRVFWGSSIYLLIGFYFSVKNFNANNFLKSSSWVGLICFAMLATLTRGVIFSIPIFFLAAYFFRWLLSVIGFGIGFLYIFGIILAGITFPVVLLSDPSLLNYFGVGRNISDDLRNQQVFSLLDSFFDGWFVGQGFGASSDEIRSESAPWSYEMSILALYMKIGLIGIFSLLVSFVLFLRVTIPQVCNEKLRRDLSNIAAFAVIVTFCGNTNPYLFSMLGIGLIVFFYIELRSMVDAANFSKAECASDKNLNFND